MKINSLRTYKDVNRVSNGTDVSVCSFVPSFSFIKICCSSGQRNQYPIRVGVGDTQLGGSIIIIIIIIIIIYIYIYVAQTSI